MLIDNIRQATAALHKKTDEYLYPFFNNIRSQEDYARVLETFYAYFQPVMKKIDEHIDQHIVPDYTERRNIDTLAADLQLLGRNAADIAPAQELPGIGNATQAMGAYYVLEGSTMGGVFLSGLIAKNLNIKDKTGIGFFTGYGGNSKSMWTKFLNYLEQYDNEAYAAAVTEAARETFRLFYSHIATHLK